MPKGRASCARSRTRSGARSARRRRSALAASRCSARPAPISASSTATAERRSTGRVAVSRSGREGGVCRGAITPVRPSSEREQGSNRARRVSSGGRLATARRRRTWCVYQAQIRFVRQLDREWRVGARHREEVLPSAEREGINRARRGAAHPAKLASSPREGAYGSPPPKCASIPLVPSRRCTGSAPTGPARSCRPRSGSTRPTTTARRR